MHVTPLVWLITIGIMALVLAFDLLVIGRRPHEPSMREAGVAIGVYSALAVLFGLGIWWFVGARFA
ncbi:MAG TPA: TerC family protein, partial [Propionicimonas sp.]|nr:TerC family protein [Propionicimonas sp.]